MTSDGLQKHRFRDLLLEPVRNGIYKTKEFHGRGCKIVNMGELFAHPRMFDVHMKRVELSQREIEKSTLSEGDLLFARRSLVAAGAGKCSIVKKVVEPTTFESSIIRARPDPNKVSSDYLFYYFSSPVGRELMGTILRQVAVSGITGSDLMELELKCPSVDVQVEAAAILGAIDDRISLLGETNSTLEGIAQALFRSWFVDFDPVRTKAEGRSPEGMNEQTAALFPDALTQSELGDIPKTWVVSKIGLELKAILGGTPSRAKPEFWLRGTIPWINSGKVNEFRITTPSEFITEEALKKSAAKLLPVRATVLAITGATLGQVSIAEISVCANQSVIGLAPTEKFSTEYIYFWINANIQKLIATQTGGAQQHINKGNVEDLLFLVPKIDVLNCFRKNVEPLFLKIAENCFQLSTLTDLRVTLLPRLISGRLRIADAKKELEMVLG